MSVENFVNLELKDKNNLKPEGRFIMVATQNDLEDYRGSSLENTAITASLQSEDVAHLAEMKGRSVVETIADMLNNKYNSISGAIEEGNVVFIGLTGSWFYLTKEDLELYNITTED